MPRLLRGDLVITDPCYVHSCVQMEINRGTIYGDWNCHTFKGTQEEAQQKIEEWNKYYFQAFHDYNFGGLDPEAKRAKGEEIDQKRKEMTEQMTYGQFCADSGQVCVFILDEDSHPSLSKFKEWAKEHPWCVTIIPDFEGTVKELVINNELHLVGTGNKPFFTAQTGF